MAVVAAGALVLAGCTSDSGDETTTPEETAADAGTDADADADTEDETADTDTETATDGGEDPEAAEGDTAKADLGDVTTNDDTVSISTGAEQYNSYNDTTSATNSTYNSVVNAQVISSFWYWGTDGTIYPDENYGTYEMVSEDPLTIEYTISDEAVWSDGTDITSNDYLLTWASTNPASMFGEGEDNSGEFDPVSNWSVYAPDVLDTEVGSKTFTVTYPEAYPDWEIAVGGALPSHVAAEQAGLSPDELAQAILDGDAETVNQVAEFWNTGWNFPNYQIEDEALVPSSGPYTLQGASWQTGSSLALVPNETYWGTPPATGTLEFVFAAPDTHVQALINGDINVIEPQATVDTISQLEGAGDAVTYDTADSMTWEHLDFNFAESSAFADENGGLAAREAFAHCVPRQQIVDSLIAPLNPDAVVMNAREKFPFQEEEYNELVSESYDGRYDEVDLDAAREKFAESGLEEGVTIRLGYSAPNPRRTDEVAAIKASCDQVGFTIEDSGSAEFFQDGGALDSGDYEVALFAWAGSGQIASGANIYQTNTGSSGLQNYGGFSSETVDEAWDTLSSSVDPEVHMEQLKVIEKALWDELYGIPIFAHPSVVGYDASLENVRNTAVQTGVSWNAEQWVRAN
ncbi:ABC transporter substrate-binding protein [Ornithinimicrobium sufpigmenti]|uniref:ABC transporter substrate-binding protein n=1 Tax=Ornithinimicrobium sufpigmenti TaxID=2508882 RepID=UPI001036E383|nr:MULTISPECIES: ABC transporter substrate-binding protein [unclassified Ornithinimicrobium]